MNSKLVLKCYNDNAAAADDDDYDCYYYDYDDGNDE